MVIQKYTIACEEGEYINKYKDSRWFEMHTRSRKGLDGHRKMGVCIGSLMFKKQHMSEVVDRRRMQHK